MKQLLRSRSAVSEVVGYLLIFALIITTVSILLIVGMPNMAESQQKANLQNVEQAFTVLDSRISTSVLGESPSQVLHLDTAGGGISILNDTVYSRLRITMMTKSGNEYTSYVI